MTPDAPGLACRLDAIPPTARVRHNELFSALRSALVGVEELPDGFDFHFATKDSVAAALAEWLSLEKLCCPFLDFAVDAGGGSRIGLRVTGPEGTKSFLRTEFPIGEDER